MMAIATASAIRKRVHNDAVDRILATLGLVKSGISRRNGGILHRLFPVFSIAPHQEDECLVASTVHDLMEARSTRGRRCR